MQVGLIEGSWSGWYGYSAKRLPTQFDVDFVFSDPVNFTGGICDNGPMGDAVAPGTQTGPYVAFTKSYVQSLLPGSSKVYYSGMVSDDGNYIGGTWKLGNMTGPWEVYRNTPNAYTPTSNVWPPPPTGYVAYTFGRLSSLEPMIVKSMPSRLVLTKRHPPEMVGLEGQIIGNSVILTLLGLFQVFFAVQHVRHYGLVSSGILAVNLAVLLFVVWAMSKFLSVINVLVFGDIYVLDRADNKLVRNGKTLASLNDINCIELKTTGASKVSNTVRIVLNSGRRIFVETGRPEDVSGLASSIAQFVGVQVVGA